MNPLLLNFYYKGELSKLELISRLIKEPVKQLLDDSVIDGVTNVATYLLEMVKGKYQRKVVIPAVSREEKKWIEEAITNIYSRYNKLDDRGNIHLVFQDGKKSYRLGPGVYSLKYKNYHTMLMIEDIDKQYSYHPPRVYTIITYSLGPDFVNDLEKDLQTQRKIILNINNVSSRYLDIWKIQDDDEDLRGIVNRNAILKRPLDTLYLPMEQKQLLVNTVRNYINSKEIYEQCGIPWNLKILLYGPPSTGKDTIAKMIATEWNRTICIPDMTYPEKVPGLIEGAPLLPSVKNPLILLSDLDRTPSLINDEQSQTFDEKSIKLKTVFGKMLNVMDGVSSGSGKIIIVTTNHLDQFSKTFIRPGRIDLLLHIDYIGKEVFSEFYRRMYGEEIHAENIELKEKNLTIATLQFDVLFQKLTKGEFLKKYLK